MARLCIEYETEMEASRRRPAGLLDALEHSDCRYGDEDEALGGEERVHLALLQKPLSEQMSWRMVVLRNNIKECFAEHVCWLN